MLKKIRHIGIVVDDIERAIAKFKNLGLLLDEVMELKEDGVSIAFFPIGDTMIEILYYGRSDSSSDAIVCKQKGFINHLCFEVDDIEATVQAFDEKGIKLKEGYPKAGAHGRVAFFYPETTEGVLIEICEL